MKPLLTNDEVVQGLESAYTFLDQPIREDNVESLRERLARITEKLPKATRLRDSAQHQLQEAKARARKELAQECYSATELRNAVEDMVREYQRVFDMSRKLHQDITTASQNVRKLLEYEIADKFNNGGTGQRPNRST